MKHQNLLRLVALLAFAAAPLAAKPIPGPKGGRIVTAAAPHIEFQVAADRVVTVAFYDQALKPVGVTAQTAIATAELPSGKVKLEFAAKDGALVSTTPLPAGEGYLVVLQVRESAAGRPTNYRVTFRPESCDECKRAEYACICDDAGGKGHEHKK